MSDTKEIKISVRNLVEFILRSGDLDTSFRSMTRAIDGTRAHQKVQKSQDENYQAEVTLKHKLNHKGYTFLIEGRADGIIKEASSICIDEIKSTTKPLESIDESYNEVHWAQAKCYAYIYALQNELDTIEVQLTYFHLETEFIKNIRKSFSFRSLEDFFYDIVDRYMVWAHFTSDWCSIRDTSVKNLTFPFEKYRIGQRELAVSVYKTIRDQKKLFVQAPTGIGKTISTLFPTIKAFSEGHTSKIFYLTAKSITRQVAQEAFIKMKEKGLRFKTLTLTAKDKICFKEERICEPEYCQYAKGHFDRINGAILDILQKEDELSRTVIEEYSRKHNICPFEFSLDLAIWVDTLICDLNYIFDPSVYLKGLFSFNKNDYTFLIDEAHNLVDRARDMFSAILFKKPFLELKRIFKDKEPSIAKAADKLNAYMLKMKKLCNEEYYVQKEMPEDILYLLNRLITESEEFLATKKGTEGHKELLELFFDCLAFLRIAELYDDKYVTYVEKKNDDVLLKMFCLDPSYLLSEGIKRGKSAIFFSATLSPMEYFKNILGGAEDDQTIILPSPFDKNNFCLMIANSISTKYKNRENSYDCISDYIKSTISRRKGNYLVFFPSYKYMQDVYERFKEKHPEYYTIIQSNIMNEEQREDFLLEFEKDPEDTLVGFAVMGGIFGEGVDLKGDRLIGAIIIGVGLPQICLERDIIKDYFNERNGDGFNYSYTYPGMNKVLQAAGRVIRTEEDKGVVLLVDERFNYASYKRIFPREWNKNHTIKSEEEIVKTLEKFYNEN